MKLWNRKRTTPICAHCRRTWPKVRTIREGQLAVIDHIRVCDKNPLNIVITEQCRRLKQSNIILKGIARAHPAILPEGSVRFDQIRKNQTAIDMKPQV